MSNPVTTHLSGVECPACGHLLNAAASVFDPQVRPRPGDLSVCVACGAPLAFQGDLRPRLLTESEIEALSERERAQLRSAQAMR